MNLDCKADPKYCANLALLTLLDDRETNWLMVFNFKQNGVHSFVSNQP
jgi:hypothetical protein